MTSRNWLRGALGVGVVAASLASGSAAVAGADPSTAPTTTAAASQAGASQAGASQAGASQSAASGDVLDQLAEQYAVGAGGGQLSNLLKVSLKLRAMGFKPSKANLEEITQAMTYRPNQNPLINALKDTIAYQSKLKGQLEVLQQAQAAQAAQSAPSMGAPPMPGGTNPAQNPLAPPAEVPIPASPVTP